MKEIIIGIAGGVVIWFIGVALVGGFLNINFIFPDRSLNDAWCIENGGSIEWKEWPNGCGDMQCKFITCVYKD